MDISSNKFPAGPALLLVLVLFLPALLMGCGKGADSMPPSAEENAKFLEMVNRTKEKAMKEDGEQKIYRAIDQFYRDTGRMPSNLTEIVAFNILDAIPEAPEGLSYMYAAEKGRVVTVRKAAARKDEPKAKRARSDALNAIP